MSKADLTPCGFLVIGDGPLALEIRHQLTQVGVPTGMHSEFGAAAQQIEPPVLGLICVQNFDGPQCSLPLVDAIQAAKCNFGVSPKYAISVFDAPGTNLRARARLASAKTLVAYAAAHTWNEDMRINGLCAVNDAPATYRQVADAAVAIASGGLDAMRGQVLDFGGAL